MREYTSLTMVAMETKICNFSVVIAMVATRKKNFFKNLNLIDSNHHCKNWVGWVAVGWDRMSQPQNVNF